MKRLLAFVLLALVLSLLAPAALAQQRAYAPENLRSLSYNDQVRVIGLEYSEQSNGRRIPDDQLRFYIDQVNRSDWTFSRIKQDIAQSLGGGGPQPPMAGGTIRCESNDNRSQRCPTPWRGPSRMVRQLSKKPCTDGRSWGSGQGLVTVWNGCRAEFAAARQIQPPVKPIAGNDRITCGSVDNRFQACAWNAAYGQPQLRRQLSKAPCVSGRTWGYDRRGLWVDDGCRAEFSARRGPNPVLPSPGSGYNITCSSNGNKRTDCAWNPNYGRPYIIERLSQASCDEGRTWGYQGGASLWVGGGCRARFGAR